jgi:putative ABC transport system permease protein
MLLVALFATTAAAIGPIYLGGAKDSVLTSDLEAAPVYSTGLTIAPRQGAVSLADVLAARRRIPRPRTGPPYYAGSLLTGAVNSRTVAVSGQPYIAPLYYRTDFCAHLQLVAGRCPSDLDEAMISTRSAHLIGVKLGERLAVVLSGGKRLVLRLVGTYLAPTGGVTSLPAYWWEESPFSFGSGTPAAPDLDSLFVTEPTLAAIPTSAIPYWAVQVDLRDGVIRTSSIAPLEQALASFDLALERSRGLVATSPVTSIFSAAVSDGHLMSSIVAVVVLELVLLALVVLYGVVTRTADARRQEVMLARLRGYGSLATLGVAMTEPTVLLLGAIPLGLLLGWAIVAVVAPAVLVGGTPIALDGLAVLASVAAAVGGLVAVALGSRSLLTAKLGSRDELGGATSGRASLVADVTTLVLAAAGLIELATVGVVGGSHSNPLAALAPGLLAAAAAVIGMRLVPLISRTMVRPTRHSRRLGLFLASRQLARRPALSRHLLPVTLAFALVTFGTASFLVANHNRARAATFDVGATQVLEVQPEPGVDLVRAVDRADPGGHEAMAVVQVTATTGGLLAVEPQRLARIGFFPSLSAPALARVALELAPHEAPAVVLRGSNLVVRVTEPARISPPVQLVASVFDEVYQDSVEVDLGTLRPGTHSYAAFADGTCQTACRVEDLEPLWSPSSSIVPSAAPFSFTLDALEGVSARGRIESVAKLAPATDFELQSVNAAGTAILGRTAGRLSTVVSRGAGRGERGGTVDPRNGLRITLTESQLDTTTSSGVLVVPADAPLKIPTVFGSVLASVDDAIVDGPTAPIEGLDGSTLNAETVAVVPSLPRVGADGAMANLSFLQREQTSFTQSGAADEVWLAHLATPSLLRRLAAAGLIVTGSATAAHAKSVLNHGGVALSLLLFLFAVAAAALLALGSSVFAVLVDSRRRIVELTFARTLGVPRSALRRSLLIEQVAVLGAGALLGLGSGLGAAALTLSSMPEFSSRPFGLPLVLSLPLGTVVLVWLGATVLLAAVAGAAIAHITSSLGPEVLRQEAE